MVWERDPAFDRESPDWTEAWKVYTESRVPDALPCKPGLKPTVFRCKPLTMNSYNRMLGEMTELGRCIEAVRYGLRKVEGFEVDGLGLVFDSTCFEKDGRDERVKADVLEKIFDPQVFATIGLAVIEESTLDPTRGRA